MDDARRAGHRVSVAFGRNERGAAEPDGVETFRIKGLAGRTDSPSCLNGLAELLNGADVVHVQNVMNPTALRMAVDRGRTVVTVQDHRVFCPGPGKTMPDGSVCTTPMEDSLCRTCLPDGNYRRSTIDLTRSRLEAMQGARLIVLSSYMARELEAAGLPGAEVIPPWVEVAEPRTDPGSAIFLGGRLVAHKGIVDGWFSWCEAGRPLPLVVAGSGALESELHGAVIRGWLVPGDLRAVLGSSRALLFPARWQEPFGILGVEALAQGTPVVVAECGGTSEWSAQGCITVRSGDVPAMAAAIVDLVSDAEGAMALGRAGQSAVRDRFTRRHIADRILDLYEEVAAT